jgi:nucleotide-binding universal stress UspA family protein
LKPAADDASILVGYDGSDGAHRAIEQTAELFPGARVLILHVWGFPVVMAAFAPGDATGYGGTVEHARAAREAEAGCAIARELGLDASPVVAYRGEERTWHTVVAVADERDVDMIAVGARGLGGLRSLGLGSAADGILHHAHRPVLVVPASLSATSDTPDRRVLSA